MHALELQSLDPTASLVCEPGDPRIPATPEVLFLLDRLDDCIADELESQWLDFKPWEGARKSAHVAIEHAVCFANAEGGVLVFGVSDGVRGRLRAIHGADRYDADLWRRTIYDGIRPNLPIEVEELLVPEGTGTLLLVRVPRGPHPPYCTAAGLYKQRIGKNCMPMFAHEYTRSRIASGEIDWSAAPAEGVTEQDLDPVEIARGRNVLRHYRPKSELLALPDHEFLGALGVIGDGVVTHAGLLLFGRERIIRKICPQHQVHYAYIPTETNVARNESFQTGLLHILEQVEMIFRGPANPEHEIFVGMYTLRVPSYPEETVREAVLNAMAHRNYAHPGEIFISHTPRELAVVSPGGFIGGITPRNILRHRPETRNRLLAQSLEKLGLVERSGIGRRRIFLPLLVYGKNPPRYVESGGRVILEIDNGPVDEPLAILLSKWRGEERDPDIDGLLLLPHLRRHGFLTLPAAADLLQLPPEQARQVMDRFTQPPSGFLDQRVGGEKPTWHLNRQTTAALLDKKIVATPLRRANPIRYAEMVRRFVRDYGFITPKECRELLGLGDSRSAKTKVSRYFTEWSAEDGFLRRVGKTNQIRYCLTHER